MVGAPGRVGTWRPARQATPHLVYTFVYDSDVDSPRLCDRLTTMTTLTYP